MTTVIKAENLSKAYQIGQFGTGTLSRDIERWWASVRGKEDPFLKIGEVNNRRIKGNSDIVWSLKDINFEIKQGEAIGIIGRNGAGKSTLLKVLSQITSPTKGSVKIKGRVASLLEVGTGFHPELTGRENIFLNGAILGMRRAEIIQKFDQIVDFSGVEKYVDTPVKRYSSGMYVRLAFAVAAHLESEILIVDEVLAVGDADFQKKCLGKMEEIGKSDGRTVLFVSHNMQMIASLCEKSILLQNGMLTDFDNSYNIIEKHLKPDNDKLILSEFRPPHSGKELKIIKSELITKLVNYTEDVVLEIELESHVDYEINNLNFTFGIVDSRNYTVCNSSTNSFFSVKPKENKKLQLRLCNNKHLMPGNYAILLNLIQGHLLNSYVSKDMIVRYNSFDLIYIDSTDGFKNLEKWNPGWGSISFESKVLEIN
jgi:lipopolysaccharide transport system ATP-binding protein